MEKLTSEPFPIADEFEASAVRLVRFGVGSPAYKRLNRPEIIKTIRRYDSHVLRDTVERTHLATAVYPWLPKRNTLRDILSGIVTYQRLFARIVASELDALGKTVGRLGISAVILKGPALWEQIYPRPWIRRVHDLDILIAEPAEMNLFVRSLERCGYYCVDDDYEAALLKLGLHYELPTFSKRIIFNASPRETSEVRQLCQCSAFALRMSVVDDFHLCLTLDLEPHRALFVYRDGSCPVVLSRYLEPSRRFQHFLKLRAAVSMPYIATKFVLDASRAIVINDGTAKCTKLMMDVVGMLLTASQNDIKDSISVADELQIAPEYNAALQCAQPFIPEVGMRNLPTQPVSDIIGHLAVMVFRRARNREKVRELSSDEVLSIRTEDNTSLEIESDI
jgi:hypothetical protein